LSNNDDHINASNWYRDTHAHYIIYSAGLQALLFVKQQLSQSQIVSVPQLPFKQFYQPLACLIYDSHNEEFFLIRDHFGFEPFYYTMLVDGEKQLCFGSNLPDVLAWVKNPVQDKQQISDTLISICASDLEYTDQTYYKDVYRVTPGHIFQIKLQPKPSTRRHVFWRLEPGTPTIQYASDSDYDAHFSALLQEACQVCCQHAPDDIALEFSGGLDSSTILTALDAASMPAQLFMHVGKVADERHYGDQLLQELRSHYPIHYINADDFDVMAVIDQCKQWFAGGAPYLFFMFAHNIHHAVQQKRCQILLSGFGGDECVSSHAPFRTYGAEVGYKKLWQELRLKQGGDSRTQRLLHALKLSNPRFYHAIQRIKSFRSLLARKQLFSHHKPYHSLQEREADWLSGGFSYHVRMRIEYSAVVAKHMGFTYQYPLLYPPLVEYCFALPPEQKRRQGQQRLLVRRYLEKNIPSGLFNAHKKCGDILPGTMPKCQDLYKKGQLNAALADLSYGDTYDYILKHQLVTENRLFHVDLLRYMFG